MGQEAATRTIQGIEAPAPGLWNIDPSHTSIDFVARYLMVSKVRGRFAKFSGALHVEERVENSWAELTIVAASIDTNELTRDGHLRSPDFLDVEHFPAITFRRTKVQQVEGTRLRVVGDLTIRDQTRSVPLDVDFLGMTADPYGNVRAAFSIRGEIDRTEFGASWNVALETGGWLVGKQVQLELEVQVIRAAGQPG